MRIVAFAASTGGPSVLGQIFEALPGDLPAALLVVQHMPAEFTRSFANRLDRISALVVREAAKGDKLAQGVAFVAPGGVHLSLSRKGELLFERGELVNYIRPSADVLFGSLSLYYGKQTVAVVLSGMGRDGAAGVAALKEAGAFVIVQEPGSASVDGMPAAAIRCGVDLILPVAEIAAAITRFVYSGRIKREGV